MATKSSLMYFMAGNMLKDLDTPNIVDFSSLDFLGGTPASQSDLVNSSPIWERKAHLDQNPALNRNSELAFNLNQLSDEDWDNYRKNEADRLVNLITNPDDQVFMMRGTGFDVITQVVSLREAYLKSLAEGKTFEDLKESFSQKAKEDLRGYFWEFVQKEPVLKINLEIDQKNAISEVVAPKYNRKPLVDTVNASEREGATKAGIVKLSKLLSSEANGLYGIASPKGWSGFYDNESGNEFLFPESQLYLYLKKDKQIEGYTFRNNLTLSELQQLTHDQLDHGNIFNSESGQIKEMVSTVLRFDTETGIKGILDQIQKIKGSDILWTEKSAGKDWTTEEVFKRVSNTSDIWETNQIVDSLINSTSELLDSIEDLSDKEMSRLIISLGKIALQIRWISRTENMNSVTDSSGQIASLSKIPMNQSDYIIEAALAQKDEGCIFQLMASTPFGNVGLEVKKLCCTCPFCQTKVEAEIKGGQIHCPNCHRSATWNPN